MRPLLLANENVPAPSIRHLRERGYDVVSMAEEGGETADEEVLARAVRERRSVITFDRDYGELIFLRGFAAPPAVFLLRLRSYRPEDPGRILADILGSESRLEGHFVLVEETGIRKRPLPQPKPVRG